MADGWESGKRTASATRELRKDWGWAQGLQFRGLSGLIGGDDTYLSGVPQMLTGRSGPAPWG